MADTNKIKYGIQDCYYAVATIASDGSATYGTPVRLPGAVSLSLSAQGERSPFYADNVEYYTSISNAGYEGTLELAKIPEDFLTDVLGYVKGGNDVLYEPLKAATVHFALLFQFEGDLAAKRHVMYNCTATRSDITGETKTETIEPQTETINLAATSVYVTALTADVVKGSVNEGDSAYSTFFTAVTLPTV